MTDTVASQELRQFIERLERLASEKSDISEMEKEVMAELKGRGYQTAIVREVLRLRKMQADDLAERDAVLDMYRSAVGM